LYKTLSVSQQQNAVQRALDYARSSKSYISSTKDEFFQKKNSLPAIKLSGIENSHFPLPASFSFSSEHHSVLLSERRIGDACCNFCAILIVYYIITISGEKFAVNLFGILPRACGFLLYTSSLGMFLSYKATNDSAIMNADFYIEALKNSYT
jgi:hypothetical protein